MGPLSITHEDSPAELSTSAPDPSVTRHVLAPGVVSSLVDTNPGITPVAAEPADAEVTDVLPAVNGWGVAPDGDARQDEDSPTGDGHGEAEHVDGDGWDSGDAEASEDRPARTRLQEKRHRSRLRMRTAARSAVCAAAAVVLIATGVAFGAKYWYDDQFTEVAALDTGSQAIVDGAQQQGDMNLLLVGSDSRERVAADQGDGPEEGAEGARADTIVLAHLPEGSDRRVFVSFPHDLEVSLDGCRQWDPGTGRYSEESVQNAENVSLAEAYAAGGPRCMTSAVQDISGMRINHFLGIDFLGVKNMVDAAGGVPITVDEPVVDDALGTIISEPGTHIVDGETGLDFVRARHVHGEATSDHGRMQRQQQFLSALLDRSVSREVLLDPRAFNRFTTSFTRTTFADNVGIDELLTLVRSTKSSGTESLDFVTVPTTGFTNARGNEVLLEAEAGELFRALIEKEPLPGKDT
ncbi:LCP family protein [Haloechinothrix sp. LS1_15]|uniref:LCP family protein n=1 Tax=Haloechinothrix sp. LS1_15 TaxID=2652248 RepID=UPI00294B51CE|nr:LCP family protein [Haloechinothrix sp. LS1_15]